MKDLSKHFKGVTPDSPPADDDPENNDTGDGRTPDNVRGELLRKMNQDKREFMSQMSGLAETVNEMKTLLRGGAPASQASNKTGMDSLDNYTADQLEGFRDRIPEENKAWFESIVQQKRLDERMDNRFNTFVRNQSFQTELERYNKAAKDRFPDLADLSSDFSLAVQAELSKVSDELVERNPRIVYDLAHEVAYERGVTPKPRRQVQSSAPTNTAPHSRGDEDELVMTDEQRKELADKFRSALPKDPKTGEREEFDLDRIKEHERYLSKNVQHHLRG